MKKNIESTSTDINWEKLSRENKLDGEDEL
jgi:hypothetical protein